MVQVMRLQASCRKQAVDISREIYRKPVAGGVLLDWHSFYRTRAQSQREIKLAEREKKRQAMYKEEAKRRRYQSYLKSIMAHRLEFSNFHRGRRLTMSKMARACVSHTEDQAAREKREEDRAERKRIQALRMNDIDAYTKLVEETKSERLKYLLGQTDQYIREIGLKIQEQREEGEARREREDAADKSSAAAAGDLGNGDGERAKAMADDGGDGGGGGKTAAVGEDEAGGKLAAGAPEGEKEEGAAGGDGAASGAGAKSEAG
ncbi:unnamed protein product, partial [Scytosiphon promiscuus]